ncbi:MAG: MarR family winged helix-turn-helix transcriptional regulator [Actinomycetota bacterium]|nr:MarR family winged helix-turn-helix transcriptional regulator [Actinomycetota bacterium]
MTESTERRDNSFAAGRPDEVPTGSADRGPWLTDRQQQTWRSFLAMWRMLEDNIERDMQQHGGIPLAYYLIMSMLSESPNRQLRMNRLAEVVGFSQSRLSHAVARLEELGWLQRQQAAADKRGQIAVLTGDGFRQLVAVAPLHAETVRSIMFDPLSDAQLEAFEELCRTILQARPDHDQQLRHTNPTI